MKLHSQPEIEGLREPIARIIGRCVKRAVGSPPQPLVEIIEFGVSQVLALLSLKEGGGLASCTDSAASVASQPDCSTAQGSAGEETAWLVEMPGPLYALERDRGDWSWTTDHLAAFRFESKEEAERWRCAYHPDASVTEHMWVSRASALADAERIRAHVEKLKREAELTALYAWRIIDENTPRDGTHILACDVRQSFGWINGRPLPPVQTVVHWYEFGEDSGWYTSVNELAPERPFPATHWKFLDGPDAVPWGVPIATQASEVQAIPAGGWWADCPHCDGRGRVGPRAPRTCADCSGTGRLWVFDPLPGGRLSAAPATDPAENSLSGRQGNTSAGNLPPADPNPPPPHPIGNGEDSAGAGVCREGPTASRSAAQSFDGKGER